MKLDARIFLVLIVLGYLFYSIPNKVDEHSNLREERLPEQTFFPIQEPQGVSVQQQDQPRTFLSAVKQIPSSKPAPASSSRSPKPSRSRTPTPNDPIQQLLAKQNIQVKPNTKKKVDENTFSFTKVMEIEKHEQTNREYLCINKETRRFNRSEEFNCSIFKEDNTKASQGLEKKGRILYFDKLCAPEVTVNTLDNTVKTRTFSRCSYFEYLDRIDGSPQFEWVCMLSYVQLSSPETGTDSMFNAITSNPFINSHRIQQPNFLDSEERLRAPTGSDPIDYLQEMCSIEKLFPDQNELTEAIEEAAKTNSIPTVCSPIICGDHSTQYTIRRVSETLENIKFINPDVKFFSFLREPVSRIELDCNLFSAGWIRTPEKYEAHLDSQIALSKSRIITFDPYTETQTKEEELFPLTNLELCKRSELEIPNLFTILRAISGSPLRSMYWLYLEKFFAEFNRSDIFIEFTDNFESNEQQKRTLDNIFAFLGVPETEYSNQDLDSWRSKKELTVSLNERSVDILKRIMVHHNQKLQEIMAISSSDFPISWDYSFLN